MHMFRCDDFFKSLHTVTYWTNQTHRFGQASCTPCRRKPNLSVQHYRASARVDRRTLNPGDRILGLIALSLALVPAAAHSQTCSGCPQDSPVIVGASPQPFGSTAAYVTTEPANGLLYANTERYHAPPAPCRKPNRIRRYSGRAEPKGEQKLHVWRPI